MIVSGFTQKNFEEEYLHGSPLDHKHCVTCVRRTCKVRADDSTSCPLVNCPRGCASRYHGCKEAEHQALCSEERVPCINSGYGCPMQLPRKRLSQHLVVCPASVVFCSAEWNRSPMDVVKPGAKADVLLKKTYTDCGQLDTAQAMRDHRALVDMLLAPPQTRRSLRNPLTQVYPAPPIGRPSPSPESDAGPAEEAAADVAGGEEGAGGTRPSRHWLWRKSATRRKASCTRPPDRRRPVSPPPSPASLTAWTHGTARRRTPVGRARCREPDPPLPALHPTLTGVVL